MIVEGALMETQVDDELLVVTPLMFGYRLCLGPLDGQTWEEAW